MGYIEHHAIIVTGWQRTAVDDAHALALQLGNCVTNVISSHTNQYYSFMVGPDGSKLGWEASDKGDENREAFVKWVRESNYYLDYVEIRYGGDEPEITYIVQRNTREEL